MTATVLQCDREAAGIRKYRWGGTVDAVQWFELGDHPAVFRRERWPEPRDECWVYWIGQPNAGFTVNPGDWIVTDANGRHSVYRPEDFEKRYEPDDRHDSTREMAEALKPFAEQKTIDEMMRSPLAPNEWASASVERRIEMMGERKRENDANILRARAVLATLQGTDR